MRFRFELQALLVIFGCSGLGSCPKAISLSEFCSSDLPRFTEKVNGAVLALQPWEGGDRKLASEGEAGVGVGPSDLPLPDRRVWESWAEERLVEAQAYIDFADGDSRYKFIRKDLSSAANDFVAFHGYASQGKVNRMTLTLAQIRTRIDRVQQATCKP